MCALKTYGLTVDEEEAVWLERIITDNDTEEALSFLRQVVRRQIAAQETGGLRSHLDGHLDPASDFSERRRRTAD